MSDPDGIEPGQTWASRYMTGRTVRVTVIDGNRVGFTPDKRVTVEYLTRRRFLNAYQQIRSTR